MWVPLLLEVIEALMVCYCINPLKVDPVTKPFKNRIKNLPAPNKPLNLLSLSNNIDENITPLCRFMFISHKK